VTRTYSSLNVAVVNLETRGPKRSALSKLFLSEGIVTTFLYLAAADFHDTLLALFFGIFTFSESYCLGHSLTSYCRTAADYCQSPHNSFVDFLLAPRSQPSSQRCVIRLSKKLSNSRIPKDSLRDQQLNCPSNFFELVGLAVPEPRSAALDSHHSNRIIGRRGWKHAPMVSTY
jgi:hypothetical protein